MNEVSFDNKLQRLNCPKSSALNESSVAFTGPMTPDRLVNITNVDLTKSSKTSKFDELA